METEKTTWLPDVNGKWQLSEIRRNIATEGAKDRSIEESVSRPDAEGKLGQISRVVSQEIREHFRRKAQRRGNLFHRCPRYYAGR